MPPRTPRLLETDRETAVLFALSLGQPPAATVRDRSEPVCVALERQLKKNRAEISAADLAKVADLELPHIHIPSFKEHDFAGMTQLKKLYFSGRGMSKEDFETLKNALGSKLKDKRAVRLPMSFDNG